jgi:4-carboxymuconolactone decarboxylase
MGTDASRAERRRRGEEKIKEVYAGNVVVPPEGTSPFGDLMLEHLWAEVWTREALSIRDRRLITMGVIAALGEAMPWGVQVRAALARDELTPEQLREILIHLAQYVGFPRASGLLVPTEQAIAEAEKK